MPAKKKTKLKSKLSTKSLSFNNPAVIVVMVLLVVAGIFLAFKSFAAAPGESTVQGLGGKDAYGCPLNLDSRPTLSQGSSGPCVKRLQLDLNILGGGNVLAIDGVFGPTTKNYVIYFQTKGPFIPIVGKLQPDGVVGPNTWHTLYCDAEVVCQATREKIKSDNELAFKL